MPEMAKRRSLQVLAAFLAVLVPSSCAERFDSSPAAAGEVRTLRHQGVERRYYLQNGEAGVAAPAPLVVSLHGYRSREKALAEREDLGRIGWDALGRVAGRERFIVAYPHAWLGKWNLFDGLDNTTFEDGRKADDIGFIFAVVSHLVEEGLADPERVYLTGFSDGAIMSYRLLCTAGMPFAAAASGAGTMFEGHRDSCAAEAPVPIMVIAGTFDAVLPYDGWIFPMGRELSIPETMEHFRRLNGCTGQEGALRYDRDGWDDSRVLEMRWTGCTVEGAVKLLKVKGGGHNWPSYEPLSSEWRKWAGAHNRDIESAEEIWKFVRRFRKKG